MRRIRPLIQFRPSESDNIVQVQLVKDILTNNAAEIVEGSDRLAAYFRNQDDLNFCCVQLLRRCGDLSMSRFTVLEY